MKCSYIQREIGCPYYLGDDGKTEVGCEGIAPGSTLRLRFAAPEEWKAWVEALCTRDWAKCPYHEIAGLKYEG